MCNKKKGAIIYGRGCLVDKYLRNDVGGEQNGFNEGTSMNLNLHFPSSFLRVLANLVCIMSANIMSSTTAAAPQ
jgi:hypothetical protein